MGGKVLFTASTYSHIVNFHLPYLWKFREEGWTVHAACGGRPMPIPDAEAKTAAGVERWMAGKTDMVLTMNRWDYETAKKYRLGQKVVNILGVGVDFSRFDRVSPDCRARRWVVEVTHFFQPLL